MIYADNAASTKVSKTAISAMLPYLNENYGNASSLHRCGQLAREALESARKTVADCLHADPAGICFTGSGTESDNQALETAAVLGEASGKKHIISTKFEHHAILRKLSQLRGRGFSVTLLDIPENGIVQPEQVAAAITADTCLVSVMFANNEIGTIQPIAEIGAICRSKGVLFHTDAVQACGHIEINAEAQNIDMLSLSGHKFHAPKGVGVLYARKGILPEPLILGGGQERGIRAGTENIPAIAGMAAALTERTAHLEANAARLTCLRDKLIADLREIPHSILNGDAVKRLPSNVHFCFEGVEGESLLLLLDAAGICASSGSACASGSPEPSHVLLAIGRPPMLAQGSLRLTLSEELTEHDIETITAEVRKAVLYLRGISPLWKNLCDGKTPYLLK